MLHLMGQVVEVPLHSVDLVLIRLFSSFHIVVRYPNRVIQPPPIALRCELYPVPSALVDVRGAFPHDVLAGLLGCSAWAVGAFGFPYFVHPPMNSIGSSKQPRSGEYM